MTLVPQVVYVLCAVTSLACTVLLLRAYRRTKVSWYGAILLGCWAIGLFFFRYWRQTRERLFCHFGAAFQLLVIERVVLTKTGSLDRHFRRDEKRLRRRTGGAQWHGMNAPIPHSIDGSEVLRVSQEDIVRNSQPPYR
jgi:hypothetical protein